VLACDFLTVEIVFPSEGSTLLFFIALASRRIEYIASGSNRDERWSPRPPEFANLRA